MSDRSWAETWADGTQLDEAVRRAVRDAVREHRDRKNPIAIWEDEQVRIVGAHEIPDHAEFATLFYPVTCDGLEAVRQSGWRHLPGSGELSLLIDPDTAIELARGMLHVGGGELHTFLLAFEVPRSALPEGLGIGFSVDGRDRVVLENAIVNRIRVVAEFARETA